MTYDQGKGKDKMIMVNIESKLLDIMHAKHQYQDNITGVAYFLVITIKWPSTASPQLV